MKVVPVRKRSLCVAALIYLATASKGDSQQAHAPIMPCVVVVGLMCSNVGANNLLALIEVREYAFLGLLLAIKHACRIAFTATCLSNILNFLSNHLTFF